MVYFVYLVSTLILAFELRNTNNSVPLLAANWSTFININLAFSLEFDRIMIFGLIYKYTRTSNIGRVEFKEFYGEDC
jgi:hypothetical protein